MRVFGILVPDWYIAEGDRFRFPPPEREASDQWDADHGIDELRRREDERAVRRWKKAHR